MLKNLKISFIISSILYMALGVVLLVWPTTSLNVICYAFGGITLLYGLFRLASYLGNRENASVLQADTFIGIIMIGLGIFLLIQPDVIRSILPIVLGLFVIFNSIIKLQYGFELKASFYDKWWILLFLGIVTAGLGTVIAVNPFATPELTVTVMGIVLVSDGISNIFTILFTSIIQWKMKRSTTDLAVVGTGVENVVDNEAPEVRNAQPVIETVETVDEISAHAEAAETVSETDETVTEVTENTIETVETIITEEPITTENAEEEIKTEA